MLIRRNQHLFAAFLSVALHAVLFAFVSHSQSKLTAKPEDLKPEEKIILVEFVQPPPKADHPQSSNQAVSNTPIPSPEAAIPLPQEAIVKTPLLDRQLATMAAPPAPTAEEWAFATKYTLKNSKGYRFTWGQQVRSMMGTAVEGPDQGVVRFRVEIAPDGKLAKLETLWTTSTLAEQLARKAIENMNQLPPPPTGRPLIFEKTISFSPFASDGPPSYKDDCLPDPPAFRNPFAWDGKSQQVSAEPMQVEKLDPQALEECLRRLPRDSIEAESARDQRLMDQWGSTKLVR